MSPANTAASHLLLLLLYARILHIVVGANERWPYSQARVRVEND